MSENNTSTTVAEEAIFGPSRRERTAWFFGAAGLAIGICGVASSVLAWNASETQAFLTIVDKTTGQVERAVQIERAVIDHSEAVTQSLLYGYVMDRETFDRNDNDTRIRDVHSISRGRAQSELAALWDPTHENFDPQFLPETVYGRDALVTVRVNSINRIDEDTSQVRFTKVWEQPGRSAQEGHFYATVTYSFQPEVQDNLGLVWSNPLGFYVTDYRVAAETLE